MANLSVVSLLFSFLVSVISLYCEPDNCYELLEVSQSATQQQIKKAYRTLARRHHPDRNRLEDTTELFQKINIAYEILDNADTRNAYNSFVQDPSGSRAYHAYNFYKASYAPQTNPFVVFGGMLVLMSWLQWVIRKQMYETAFNSVLESESFRVRVNEQCEKAGRKRDRRYKQEIREKLQEEITISGGYSKPQPKELLICRFFLLPYSMAMFFKAWARWIWKYYVKRQDYEYQDQQYLTRKALKIPLAQWEYCSDVQKKALMGRRLWIHSNMKKYEQERLMQQLEQIKETNPSKYRRYMAYIKKNS